MADKFEFDLDMEHDIFEPKEKEDDILRFAMDNDHWQHATLTATFSRANLSFFRLKASRLIFSRCVVGQDDKNGSSALSTQTVSRVLLLTLN